MAIRSVTGEGPEDVFGAAVVGRFVGEELIHRRAPEVAVGEVGGRVAVELEDGLVAVVDPVVGFSGRTAYDRAPDLSSVAT
jgi:hypothetical protein